MTDDSDNLSGQEVPPEDLPSGAEVLPEDLPSEDTATAMSGQEVPPEDLPDEDVQEQYGTPGQMALTGVEALGRGVSGGLSDVVAQGMRAGAENLGVPEQYLNAVAPSEIEIAARQQANPGISATGEIIGNIGLMARLPEIGSSAINGMLQMGLISGSDELSKALLGQGDPLSAVAWHIAGSSALGLIGGKMAEKAASLGNSALKSLEDAKIGTKLTSFLAGVGHAATFPGSEAVDLANSAMTNTESSALHNASFRIGQEAYQNIPKYLARIGAPIIGERMGGVGTAAISYGIEQVLEKAAPGVSKRIAPAILKAAASGTTENLSDVFNHATIMSRGFGSVTDSINRLFEASGNKAIDYVTDPRKRDKLNEFLENGGVDQEVRDEAQQQGVSPQSFSEGGKVIPLSQNKNPIAEMYPEQNILLNAAKARVSNYLNSLRPVDNPTRPFDIKRDDPNKKREYEKSLDMANQPLSILNKIKDGSLSSDHMKTFTSMYPELHSELSKQITKKMAEENLNGEKRPPYKVRQALSLFTGASLDSTMTPQNMMAVQAIFQAQNVQKQQASITKAAGLSKMAKMSQTPVQGSEERLNKT